MIPEFAAGIVETIENAGFEAYFAGGCVRDRLMGLTPNDWDITTSAQPEEIMKLFPKTVPTGIRYGTVTVLVGDEKAEVTTFRTEGKYCRSRKPETVQFVASLEEDLKRRDFTINAMAMRRNGEIIDLFDGKADIEKKVIRCVGDPVERFSEDALRMLRAVRFSAKLGFALSEDTINAIRSCSGLASELSAERVRDEVEKTLVSDLPEKAGSLLEYGLLDNYVNYNKSVGIDFSSIKNVEKSQKLRWSAFCGVLNRNIIMSTKCFLESLRLDRHTVRDVSAGVKAAEDYPQTKSGIKMMIAEIGDEAALCAAAAYRALSGADSVNAVREILAGGEPCHIGGLDITGDVLVGLGIDGRQIGATLKKLIEAVAEDPGMNEREKLVSLAMRINKTV